MLEANRFLKNFQRHVQIRFSPTPHALS
jgi:hypothetical protein